MLFTGWLFGDPHIRTLDGKDYTFNGLGEYILVRTSNDSFVLEGRTALVEGSRATIFSAFAAAQFEESDDFSRAQLTSSVVHVERTSEDGLVVRVCCYGVDDELTQSGSTISGDAWREITEQFSVLDNVTQLRLDDAVLLRPNEKTLVAVFTSEVSVKIEAKNGLLDVVWAAPETFQGGTSGLLGVWDDDINNDITARDGIAISINSSDRIIHQTAQTCM